MKRYKIGGLILAIILLIGLGLWLIGALTEWKFGFGEFVAVTFGGWAIFFLIAALLAKNLYGLEIISIVCAFFSLLAVWLVDWMKFVPALIIFLLFAVVAVVAKFMIKKAWDSGDNNNPEYKKYERKDGR